MNRFIRRRPSTLRMIAAGLAVAIASSAGLPGTSRADDKPAGARGKITVYAAFYVGNFKQEWGLHVVDPATDAWTKVAEFPQKNGVVAMAGFRVAPDGTRLAFTEYKITRMLALFDSVWLREIRPGAEPRKISDIGGLPSWSPDGKQLLVVESARDGDAPRQPFRFVTWKIDDDGSHPVRLPIPESVYINDWSPDGRWLAGISLVEGKDNDFELVVMHPDGTGKRRLPGSGGGLRPRFSPDSKRLAYVEASREDPHSMKFQSIRVVDVDGENPRHVYQEPDDAHLGHAVAWSPDGRRLAATLSTWTRIEGGSVTPRDPRLVIFDVEGGKVRIVPHPPAAVLGLPEWR